VVQPRSGLGRGFDCDGRRDVVDGVRRAATLMETVRDRWEQFEPCGSSAAPGSERFRIRTGICNRSSQAGELLARSGP
jgi:hypothetical protein